MDHIVWSTSQDNLCFYLLALPWTPPSCSNSLMAWQKASMQCVGGVNRNCPVFSRPSYWSQRSKARLREFPVNISHLHRILEQLHFFFNSITVPRLMVNVYCILLWYNRNECWLFWFFFCFLEQSLILILQPFRYMYIWFNYQCNMVFLTMIQDSIKLM